MTNAGPYQWMERTLIALFDNESDQEIGAALRSDDERVALKDRLNTTWSAGNRDTAIPEGSYADNLFQGLLALRMKFDRQTALGKLALNLAMRNPPNSPD